MLKSRPPILKPAHETVIVYYLSFYLLLRLANKSYIYNQTRNCDNISNLRDLGTVTDAVGLRVLRLIFAIIAFGLARGLKNNMRKKTNFNHYYYPAVRRKDP